MNMALAKMERKYGSVFLADLNRLIHNPIINGNVIAQKYGISRERVRQICDRAYGKGFLSWRKKRLQGRKKFFSLMKRYELLSKQGHLRSQAMYSIFERLEEMGLLPQINGDGRLSEISLKNGKILKLKVGFRVTQMNGHRYFVVRLISHRTPSLEHINCLIVALYLSSEFVFYVLPKEVFKDKKYLCFSPWDAGCDRYWEYCENWSILL